MAYEAYTPPPQIEPSRKKLLYGVAISQMGELNATFDKPIQDDTLATWVRHRRHLAKSTGERSARGRRSTRLHSASTRQGSGRPFP